MTQNAKTFFVGIDRKVYKNGKIMNTFHGSFHRGERFLRKTFQLTILVIKCVARSNGNNFLNLMKIFIAHSCH